MPLLKSFETPIWAAMFGFVLALLLLTKPGCKASNSAFTEIKISGQRGSVTSMLQNRLQQLNKLDSTLADSIKIINCSNDSVKECKAIIAQRKQVQREINATHFELDQVETYNSDTALSFYLRYFSIDRGQLDSALRGFEKAGNLRVYLKDSCALLHPIVKKFPADLQLGKVSGEPLMSYVMRNPAAGYTLIICIGQMTLWFLLGTMLFGQLQPIAKGNWRNFAACLITPLLVVGLFVWLFYVYLTDDFLIKDSYTLENFNNRAFIYGIPGYLLAVCCFSVFIYAANRLDQYNQAWLKLPAPRPNPATDPAFQQRRSLLNTAFLFSALVLSVFIFESGVLVHAVNSMEAMRLYELLANRPFVPGDSIYMIAVIHSILLLVFYLPVMLKVNSLEVVQDAKQAATAAAVANGQPQKVLSTIWSGLEPILITASPLIAGALQQLLELFFKD
jgi:hypothetical protein